MPQNAQSDPAREPADIPASFEWTRDPVVLVSRRPRNIAFPGGLIHREPTAADLKAWRDPNARNVISEHKLTLWAGVNFLGALTSAWALRSVPGPGQAPRSPPADGDMMVVTPDTTASALLRGPAFVDRETRRVVPARVHAALLRVVEWLRGEEKHLERERGVQPLLFTADDGFDPEGPEVALLPLSEVFSQRTDRGRYAYAAAKAGIKWAKSGAHLGALHDYACRDPSAWLLAQDARERLGRAPSLAGTGAAAR
jgi:hypothetical protein